MLPSWKLQEFRPVVIPDLDLPKYAGSEVTGFRSVLESFETLLPVLHAMCIGYGARLQLLLHGGASRTFEASLMVMHRNKLPIPIKQIFDASLIGRVFQSEIEFAELRLIDLSERLQDLKIAVEITRAELEFELGQTGAHHTDRNSIYSTAAWKPKRNCRLNMTFKLMDTLPERSAVLLTLNAVDDRDAEALRLSTMEQVAIANKFLARDVDEGKKRIFRLLRSGPERRLEKIAEDVLSFPCFRMSLRVYGQTTSTARMISSSLLSEAYETSPCTIRQLPISQLYDFEETSPILQRRRNEPVYRDVCGVFAGSEIAPLFRLPLIDAEEKFSMPIESTPQQLDGTGILLGRFSETNKEFRVSLDDLNRHALIAGMSGSGKTNTLKSLELFLLKSGIPFMVIEPAKREHRDLLTIAGQSNLRLAIPGDNAAEPEYDLFGFSLNPFQFTEGLTLRIHINNLIDAFRNGCQLNLPPAISVLEQAIWQVYKDNGWGLHEENCGSKRYPKYSEFMEVITKKVQETKYQSFKGDLQAIIDSRLGTLCRRELKQIFDVEQSKYSPSRLLDTSMILELDGLSQQAKSFVTFVLLGQLREALQVRHERDRKEGLRHVLIIEEAHRLLSPQKTNSLLDEGSAESATVDFVVELLAEVRALGQGIILADQLPSGLAPEVIKNTNIKICHRLTAIQDRDAMARSMSASIAQSQKIPAFERGETLVSTDSFMKPFSAKMSAAETKPLTRRQMSALQRQYLIKLASMLVKRGDKSKIRIERLIRDQAQKLRFDNRETAEILEEINIISTQENPS